MKMTDDIARSVYKTRNTVWLPKEFGATGLIIGRWRQSVHAQRNASTESFLRWKPNLELDTTASKAGAHLVFRTPLVAKKSPQHV